MVTLVEHIIYYPWGPKWGDEEHGLEQDSLEYELSDEDIRDFIENGVSLKDKRAYAKDICYHMTDKELQELEDLGYDYTRIDSFDAYDLDEAFGVSDYLREIINLGELDSELEEYFKDEAREYFFG